MDFSSQHSPFLSPDDGPPEAWAKNRRRLRWWLVLALLLSLGIHWFFFRYSKTTQLERFVLSDEPHRLVPRPITMKRAKIDPRVFDEPEKQQTPEEKTKLVSPQTSRTPQFQDEKPVVSKPDNIKISPAAPEFSDPLPLEKPGSVKTAASTLPAMRSTSDVEKNLNAARAALEQQTAPVVNNNPIKLPSGESGQAAAGTADGTPMFSDLDALLSQAGPLSGSVAPVAMPGGALFDYDSAELREDAMATLQKLGELIRRNPRATFSIEGHTDSTGEANYNQRLSELRAEAVKNWLVREMGIDPARITTRGFGSTRLVAPATGTKEEQAINRRVEIVIKTPKD